ncbi:MAG: hypothetical protein RPT25_13895 [Cycloclasticus sp.]
MNDDIDDVLVLIIGVVLLIWGCSELYLGHAFTLDVYQPDIIREDDGNSFFITVYAKIIIGTFSMLAYIIHMMKSKK